MRAHYLSTTCDYNPLIIYLTWYCCASALESQCVCGVYRAHIIDTAQSGASIETEEGGIFYDDRNKRCNRFEMGKGYFRGQQPKDKGVDTELISTKSKRYPVKDVPSRRDIAEFFRDVFRRSKMEKDCIILSLIYIERVIHTTNGSIRPSPDNWKSILFSSMILASKVWDDLSMWNGDFSTLSASFSLARINELEVSLLNCLKFKVKVSSSEYAKYYFMLRTMMIRGGLIADVATDADQSCNMEGARLLESVSEKYERKAVASEKRRRSRSLNFSDALDVCKIETNVRASLWVRDLDILGLGSSIGP